ncbi:hypothetical protein TNCT_167011 [Trichonephila clavata]|uniref:Uncharacterized protein n=1 Tax=Trichonephila clavata TaxID=2740835 RepID=A0A8X6GVU4_TRICU|nr:hypothetical protein TNCT_167011 [Trichonephila clavata]
MRFSEGLCIVPLAFLDGPPEVKASKMQKMTASAKSDQVSDKLGGSYATVIPTELGRARHAFYSDKMQRVGKIE